MFPPGHVGIALALYAPVGLILLWRGRGRTAVAGTVAVAALTMLPDVDSWLPWFEHRGQTHTVWFALAVGALTGAVAASAAVVRHRKGGDALGLGVVGLVVGTLAVLAHLLGDVITPMGVRPLYPVSDATYTFSLVFASDPVANARLFALGCVATVAQVLLGVGLGQPGTGRPSVRRALHRLVDGARGSNGRRDVPGNPDLPTDRRVSPDPSVATSGTGRETDD